MGKNKGKKPVKPEAQHCSNSKGEAKQKQPVKTSGKECTCLLLRGEKATGIVEYVQKLGDDIITIEPPAGEAATVICVEGMLIDTAKEVFFKLIHMAFREFERGLCFQTLETSNIVVTMDGLLKIRSDNTIDAGDKMVEDNVHQLGVVIETVVTACSDRYSRRKTNIELKYLLGLLKRYTVKKSTYLIKYPPTLVPLCNRPYYYWSMHNHTLDIIRWNDPRLFDMIMCGLEIPKNWYALMATNAHIKEHLDRGKYDPYFDKASTVPDIEPLKSLRNLPAHPREGAASGHLQNLRACGNASDPSTFNNEDMARAIYARMPMVMCSMAKGLDFAGELCKLRLEALFPGRLQVLQDK